MSGRLLGHLRIVAKLENNGNRRSESQHSKEVALFGAVEGGTGALPTSISHTVSVRYGGNLNK